MSNTHDLTERLATAAADAVRARRTAIEAGGDGVLRSISIEVETANNGMVRDVTRYLSWKQTVRGKGI